MNNLRPQIILFGDSITQLSFGGTETLPGAVTTTRFGWGSMLSAAYARRADVYNRGFSGYNTRHALELVPKLFGNKSSGGGGDNHPSSSSSSSLFCTVFFGANDAALPPPIPNDDNNNDNGAGLQHVPMDEYAGNLKQIIKSIRKETKNSNLPIIIITPPPVDEEKWKNCLGLFDHHDRTNTVTREYGLAAATMVSSEFNENNNCFVLDAWKVLKGNEGPDVYGTYLADGLHLTEVGNQLLYDGIMDLIHTKLKHLAPVTDDDESNEGLKLLEPAWQELC